MSRTHPQAAEIERVLERFNFKYVSLVMDLIGGNKWTGVGAPSPSDLRDEAKTLLDDAARQGPPNGRSETGELVAEWIRDDDDKPCLRLSFVLEDADSSP